MNSSSGSYDDEPLVSMTVTDHADADFDAQEDGFSLRAPEHRAAGVRTPGTGARSPVHWVEPGVAVEIGGIEITGGFFYTGDVQRSHPDSIEACVIDARMDVARDSANPAADLDTIALGYGTFTAEQRRTYLEWLASERKKSDIHTGYLFFYLYGFERRVLVDGAAGKVSDAEYADIVREMRRLLNLDANYNWQKHVRGLIDAVSLMASRGARMYEQAAPDGAATGYQVPLNVRVAFGQAALDQHPLPAEWALAWVKLDPMMVRRTAVTRCSAEFDRVFMRRYRERFHEGLLLQANRTKLDATPQPAFRALKSIPVPGFLVGLPDVAAVNGPRNKLQLLMNESAYALDAYSRYLGRYPEAQGTLEATLMLPVDLWPHATHDEIDALAKQVKEGTVVSTFGAMLGRFGSKGGLTRDKATTFCTALGERGVAIEPDVRLGARTPKAGDALALFAMTPSAAPLPVDEGYDVAALMIDLAASVARLHGDAPDVKHGLIDGYIDNWSHLTAAQRTRLKARSRVQLAQPSTSTGLKKKLAPLSASVKASIAAFVVQMAKAEGVVSREEVKWLEKVYRMLDVDTQRLYSGLHQRASGSAAGTPWHAPKKATPASAVSFALDPTRIAALKHETARVSAILADVFVEEAPVVKAEAPVPAPAIEQNTLVAPTALLGLDDAHSSFLRLLVSRPAWTRAELAAAASHLELMLDGAIEQVNEASLDHWDEPLTDGDDPVEINQEVAQRLAA